MTSLFFSLEYAIEINHQLEVIYKPFHFHVPPCGQLPRTRIIWPLFAET